MKRAAQLLIISALGTAPAVAQVGRPIDLTNFVVVGEGIAAGYANFSLQEVYQANSFPAILARQMKVVNFPQPLIQAPGLGNLSGFPSMPARVPGTLQDTVRVAAGPKPAGRLNAQPPFDLFVFNVSVPGNKVADALTRRPILPLIQTYDPQQTLINMILGFPSMVSGVNKPTWTQMEYARQINPSFAIIATGYYDFVDAVAKGDAALLPDTATFKAGMTSIATSVPGRGVPVVLANVPDPVDSGYTQSLASAANTLSQLPAGLQSIFQLKADDRVTVSGIVLMGSRLLSGQAGPLPAGSVVSAALATQVSARVRAVNADIAALATQIGAPLVDMQAIFALARANGVVAGNATLTADFQGGIYSLDGFYPGATLQAVIANQFLTVINKTYGTAYALSDVAAISATDPVRRTLPASRRPGQTEVQ